MNRLLTMAGLVWLALAGGVAYADIYSMTHYECAKIEKISPIKCSISYATNSLENSFLYISVDRVAFEKGTENQQERWQYNIDLLKNNWFARLQSNGSVSLYFVFSDRIMKSPCHIRNYRTGQKGCYIWENVAEIRNGMESYEKAFPPKYECSQFEKATPFWCQAKGTTLYLKIDRVKMAAAGEEERKRWRSLAERLMDSWLDQGKKTNKFVWYHVFAHKTSQRNCTFNLGRDCGDLETISTDQAAMNAYLKTFPPLAKTAKK